jgi:ribosomal subunit interface protein
MIKEPEISFRSIEQSDAIEAAVRDRIDRLERLFQPITGITVTIDAPHRQHHTGKIYTVDIDLTVPGDEIVVNRDPQKNHAHEDIYVAVRDAFDAAERQLKRYAEKQRGEVKRHEVPPHGQVIDLFFEEGYGFIEAADGRRIYFHQNAVAEGNFEDLEVGSVVEFVARQGDEGPQASTVKPTTVWKIG